jgi:dTDP-4-dehydrorhamnose 3,5-epimerase
MRITATHLPVNAESKKQRDGTEGFADGFVVLSDTSEFLYRVTDYYAPAHEHSLLWNDPEAGPKWPFLADTKLAAKDAAAKHLPKAENFA